MRSVTMRLCLSAAIVAGIAACRVGSLGPPPVVAPTKQIAVLPFVAGGDFDDAGRFQQATDTASFPEDLPDHAAQQLTHELTAIAAPVIGAEQVRRAAPPAGAAIYSVDLAARVGAAVGAKYAAMGVVSRYVERVGTSVGVESPASVAWKIVLVDVQRRAIAGTYRLDYTQSPLSDDLKQLPLWLQGKFGWMTRQEIFDGSLRHAARQIARTVASTPTS